MMKIAIVLHKKVMTITLMLLVAAFMRQSGSAPLPH
jgi:hypothetical protein